MKFTPPLSKEQKPIDVYVINNLVIVENSKNHHKNVEIKSALIEAKWTVENFLLSDGYAVFDGEYSEALQQLAYELTCEYKD